MTVYHTYGASCCGMKNASGPRVGAFSSNVMKKGDFLVDPHNDSLEYQVIGYGYYGNSWSKDGHSGDPLGTGGKWPLAYDLSLYREQDVSNQVLLKRDMREQYVDFGYIPLWRANTLSFSGKYRISPVLTGMIQGFYGGEPGKPGVNANGSLGIGEVSLLWAPINISHLWIRVGNIFDAGTYAALYDQNPLENFLYTGLMASWSSNIGNSIKSVSSIALGGSFLNSTYLLDPDFDVYSHPGYIRAGRQRTFIYGKSSALIGDKVGVKALCGVQIVPEDSSADRLKTMYHYSAAKGFFGGAEATLFGREASHTLMVTAARGDAILGWGAPDYVIRQNGSDPIDPSNLLSPTFGFTRDGSSCFNALYWSALEMRSFHLQAGIWYNGRFPKKASSILVNPLEDSIRLLLPQGAIKDSMVTMTATNFHAIRFTVFPSVQIKSSPLFLGVRYDNITYLTPDAHTNMIEFERDQTLRQVHYTGIDGSVYGPSLWDREAVNANIVAPTLRLDFKDQGGITAAYAIGFYNKPIDRQGVVGRVHSNFTLGADFQIVLKRTRMIRP